MRSDPAWLSVLTYVRRREVACSSRGVAERNDARNHSISHQNTAAVPELPRFVLEGEAVIAESQRWNDKLCPRI